MNLSFRRKPYLQEHHYDPSNPSFNGYISPIRFTRSNEEPRYYLQVQFSTSEENSKRSTFIAQIEAERFEALAKQMVLADPVMAIRAFASAMAESSILPDFSRKVI